ncbi:MAG TPA: hypothetical protein DCR87_03840 [Acidobacteria bacterium]|nr:hypothetical protein [Acidobacteriota bacterium]
MKRGQTLIAVLTIFFILAGYTAISAQTKDQKKALDAFITATTKSNLQSEPVPGAEITVEQIGPVTPKLAAGGESGPAEKTQFDVILKAIRQNKLVTNSQGEFTLLFTPDQLNKLPEEFQLTLTVKPKDPNKFPSETNHVTVKLKKSEGPKYDLFVNWQKSTLKSNKGVFIVNGKAQT